MKMGLGLGWDGGLGTGDWGLGTGDWGLGTGDWGPGLDLCHIFSFDRSPISLYLVAIIFGCIFLVVPFYFTWWQLFSVAYFWLHVFGYMFLMICLVCVLVLT